MNNANLVVVINNISQMRKMKSYLIANKLEVLSSTDRNTFPVYYYLRKTEDIYFVRETQSLMWCDEQMQKKSVFDENYSDVVPFNTFIEKGGWTQ